MAAHSLRHDEVQRLLAVRPAARSAHFALHHVAARSVADAAASPRPAGAELSTGTAHDEPGFVDNSASAARVGSLVPKRHAKRAVTRNLLRRQVLNVFDTSPCAATPGLWLVRLTAPWPKAQWPSAASDALRAAVRSELLGLLRRHRRDAACG